MSGQTNYPFVHGFTVIKTERQNDRSFRNYIFDTVFRLRKQA